MAKNKNHSYSISLDVKSTAASKQAFKELQTAFESSNKDMDALNASYVELSKHTKDAVELEKQYNKVISKRLSEKDEEIEKLKAEKVAITANMKLTQKQKEEMIALVDESIKRVEVDKKYIKAKEKEAKLLAKTNKLFRSNFSENSKAYKLAQNAVKLQEKLNNLIGKESKLRKAASKMASAGAKVGKAGLKAGAGIAGGALALGGAMAGVAAGAANEIAEKERALGSLKPGIDPSVVDSVYIKTGVDYPSIITAINNLSDVTKDSALLVQGAVLDIQNPGIGKLLLSTSNMEKSNISELNAALMQIKKQTGIQDLSAALEAATKSGSVTNDKVSQTEYVQAFAALQQRGFDEEQIERIIRDTASKKGEFIDNLNKADLRKYTNDEQMKIRLANAPLELQRLALNGEELTKSNWQSTAERMRAIELKKTVLLEKLLPVFDKVIDGISSALDSMPIQKIADGLVNLFTSVLPLLKPVFELLNVLLPPLIKASGWLAELASDFLGTFVVPLVGAIKRILDDDDDESVIDTVDEDKIIRGSRGIIFTEEDYKKAKTEGLGAASKLDKEVVEKFFKKYGMPMAQNSGSVVPPNSEHIALVLPDYSNIGRTSQIIQNFNTNQSFNMESNQQTPLAFSQAVGNNRFIKRVNGL